MSGRARPKTITQKLIEPHLVYGDESRAGNEIALAVDPWARNELRSKKED